MIYVALILIVIVGAVMLFLLKNNGSGVQSLGYTYLKYNDGVYVGTENTEYGDIIAEVSVKDEQISNVTFVAIPDKYMDEIPTLKDDITNIIFSTIEKQDVSPVFYDNSSAYVVNKAVKAVRNALDKSLLEQ